MAKTRTTFVDLTGQRIGMLTVVAEAGKGTNGNYQWLCRCDCGEEKVIASSSLVRRLTSSCGCYHKKRTGEANKGTASLYPEEYPTWKNMKARCFNPNCAEFSFYGGRGITVCDRWAGSYENFITDMGRRPADHELERVDVNGNYAPGNCVWLHGRLQNRNKRTTLRVVWGSQNTTLKDVAELTGKNYQLLWSRLVKQGLSIEEAVARP